MAQVTVITMVDDLDKNEIPKGTAQTVNFAIDGSTYEIDLRQSNADDLRRMLEPYIEAGRRTSGPQRRSRGNQAAPQGTELDDRRQMREWARQNGFPDLGERGRIPQAAKNAYEAFKAS